MMMEKVPKKQEIQLKFYIEFSSLFWGKTYFPLFLVQIVFHFFHKFTLPTILNFQPLKAIALSFSPFYLLISLNQTKPYNSIA